MKIINKILIIPFILIWLISNITLADDSDCWTFGNMPYKQEWSESNWFAIVNSSRETNTFNFSKFLSIDEQKAIISKDDLNTALLNLKKYCCENELWWLKQKDKTCQEDAVFFNENSLDSKYLFDHIFDIIMRRLNWLSWSNDIYTKTSMTVDDLGSEWRSWINNEAEDLSWSNPQLISDKYMKYWKASPTSLGYDITTQVDATFWDLSDQNFLLYVSWQWASDESTQIATALKKYKERTLYDRYHNACALAEYFYSLFDVWINSSDKVKTIKIIANWTCNNATQKQIEWENKYVTVVTQKSSNLFLWNYIKWYITYLYDRQKKLQATEKDSGNKFLDVVRWVPHLVKTCVK